MKIIIIAHFLFFGLLSYSSQAQETWLFSHTPEMNQLTEELSEYLRSGYKNEKFTIADEFPENGDVIVLKLDKKLSKEAFNVCSSKDDNNRFVLTVSGGNLAGVRYAVYQLLEELKYGFYLSYEIIPETNKPLDLEGICFSDKPEMKNRIVFNWHNFLSGCSSWNFKEWKQYIDNTSKMRFNGLMFHFYANDPSITFSHNGVEKMAGFMPNTRNGRQYGTQQVNDVTRMAGGEIFDSPVFGSDASKAADEDRVRAAQELVQDIHKYAASKSMNIWMGYDVDYALANPPEIIATLPESAKIHIKRTPRKYFGMPDSMVTLPVPDSPEGYDYYKSQINQLFEIYPEINELVLWTRTGRSAFLTVRYDEFPENWKYEFDKIADSNPKIDKTDENITGRFATAKIYHAVQKALAETGRNNINLWSGSWQTSWLEEADWFYPDDVGFIPLDYFGRFFTDPDKINTLKKVSQNRKLIPIVWAHHDDGDFIGSPYNPYDSLSSKIDSIGNTGVGIIHWTTKPLDIYFKNVEQQIWSTSANASLEQTARSMAALMVSSGDVDEFSSYLVNWVTEGPKFGRETREFFMHEISKSEYETALEKGRERIELLQEIKDSANAHVKYFKAMEKFYIEFYKTHYQYQQALEAFNSGKYQKAAGFLNKIEPEKVINQYAEASGINGLTRGEQGVVVEMNLGWIPNIQSLEQSLRLREVRYNIGFTNFPDLGVGLLRTNFFIDKDENLWRNLGEAETGGNYFTNKRIFQNPANNLFSEIASTGVESPDSIVIYLKPVAHDISAWDLMNPDYFIAGDYQLTLIFNEHKYSNQGDRIFEVKVTEASEDHVMFRETMDLYALSGEKNKIVTKNFPVKLNKPGSLQIKIIALEGKGLINGVIFR